jgi:transcriptional regulator with XRE-family HTH domain
MQGCFVAGKTVEGFHAIGARLAALRVAAGLTQRDLAQRMRKPPSFIAKLELAERRLDLLDLQALALALETDAASLAVALLDQKHD